jgi:fibro-slime domain-containing protein
MEVSQVDNIVDNQIDNIVNPKIESAEKIISSYQNGLYGVRYNGYFDDNNNWFLTAEKHGDTNILTQIDNFSSIDDFYSWEWNGYFKPTTSELYTFYTNSDDASYLFINNTMVVNNGGLHGLDEQSGTITLTAGNYYPIKIQFGENESEDLITVSFSTNTIPKTTNGEGKYFYK